MIGRRLVHHLGDCLITSRDPERARTRFAYGVTDAMRWNAGKEPMQLPTDWRPQAIVNLVGEPIAEGRWTRRKKERIRSSRIDATRQLVQALETSDVKPRVLVSASAVGIYGSRRDEVLSEQSELGDGFLAELCQAWETEARRAEILGIRVVTIRIGVVLSRRGGALAKLVKVFRWGMGGTLGDGKQWMSWIHIDDLVALIRCAIENDSIRGPLNAVSPLPVTNRKFTRRLAQVLNRPAPWRVPYLALRLGLGEFAETLLESTRVKPLVAIDQGFDFQFGRLENCLRELLVD